MTQVCCLWSLRMHNSSKKVLNGLVGSPRLWEVLLIWNTLWSYWSLGLACYHFMANRCGNSGNSGWLQNLGSNITADGDCSHEIKRRLLLGRKVVTNLDSILKIRDIILPTKVCLVKAMVFQWSCMDVRVGLWIKLSAEKLMLLNCGVGEDS